MDNKDKEIAELTARLKICEDKLAIYEEDASAKFYVKLLKAIDHIGTELDNKTLDFDTDTFAQSVLTLSEKSGKLFDGLKNGKDSFIVKSEADKDSSTIKKLAKMGSQVGI
jgi:hypothetical protein